MISVLVGAAVGIIVALICIWAYRKGVETGRGVKDGTPFEPLVKSFKQRKEEKEADRKLKEALAEEERLLTDLEIGFKRLHTLLRFVIY